MMWVTKWIALIALNAAGMFLANRMPQWAWFCGWANCLLFFTIQRAFDKSKP